MVKETLVFPQAKDNKKALLQKNVKGFLQYCGLYWARTSDPHVVDVVL